MFCFYRRKVKERKRSEANDKSLRDIISFLLSSSRTHCEAKHKSNESGKTLRTKLINLEAGRSALVDNATDSSSYPELSFFFGAQKANPLPTVATSCMLNFPPRHDRLFFFGRISLSTRSGICKESKPNECKAEIYK